MSKEIILKVNDLQREFVCGDEKIIAVNKINLEVKCGEFVVITGPSGSGKTTLLNLLSGLDKADGGSIYFNGIRFDNLSDSEKTKMRRYHLSMIFQSFQLIPVMTCYDNILYPLKLAKVDRKEAIDRVHEISSLLGIDHLLKRKPTMISGGQAQRVAVARSLVMKNKLVLGDEITGNIDQKKSEELISFCKYMSKIENRTFIIVTHDLSILKYADRCFRLVDGCLEEYYDIA